MAMIFWARTPATPTSARPTGDAAVVVSFDVPLRLVASMVMRKVVKVRFENDTTWPAPACERAPTSP